MRSSGMKKLMFGLSCGTTLIALKVSGSGPNAIDGTPELRSCVHAFLSQEDNRARSHGDFLITYGENDQLTGGRVNTCPSAIKDRANQQEVLVQQMQELLMPKLEQECIVKQNLWKNEASRLVISNAISVYVRESFETRCPSSPGATKQTGLGCSVTRF